MSIYDEVARVIAENRAAALCTIIETSGSTPRHEGSKLLVFEDGSFTGTVGGGEVESRVIREALEAIREGKTRLLRYSMVDPAQGDPGVCGGTLEVYVEPILPKPVMVIIGGGHVGKALAHLAKWLEFKVAISDDRVEFCNPQANPDGDFFYPLKMEELPMKMPINPRTYLVLTTRGSNVDIEGLEPLLRTDAAYIGVIGSKRRWLTTRKALLAKGVPEDLLNKVHSPIGIELNAETPEEIAVSIMAEVLMVKNGGSGERMRI